MHKNIFQSTKNNTYVRLDPRLKLFLVLVINIVCISGDLSLKILLIKITLTSIPVLLLLLSKKVKSGLILGVICFTSMFLGTFIMENTSGMLNLIISISVTVIGRMFPGVIMGYYLVSTTTVSEFIASMERIHITQKIVIPFAVMFRFFPTVIEESNSIKEAMRIRGISLAGGNLMGLLEYRLVPLMMSIVKIADELSAASLTRGLGSPDKRTNICKIGFSILDWFLLILSITCFITFFIIKRGGFA